MAERPPNFDLVARPYRWLEYLSFGRFLERCRFFFLSELGDFRRALIFGDGDGRFTARLLATNPSITVEAVDSSAAMLRLLAERVSRVGPSARERLDIWHGNALEFRPCGAPYDLIATHFFLDCLSEGDVAALIGRVRPHLAPGATWVISEFAIPPRQPAALFGRLVVGTLYRIFGALTALKVRHLPDYASLLRNAGFELIGRKSHLFGLLASEMWVFRSET